MIYSNIYLMSLMLFILILLIFVYCWVEKYVPYKYEEACKNFLDGFQPSHIHKCAYYWLLIDLKNARVLRYAFNTGKYYEINNIAGYEWSNKDQRRNFFNRLTGLADQNFIIRTTNRKNPVNKFQLHRAEAEKFEQSIEAVNIQINQYSLINGMGIRVSKYVNILKSHGFSRKDADSLSRNAKASEAICLCFKHMEVIGGSKDYRTYQCDIKQALIIFFGRSELDPRGFGYTHASLGVMISRIHNQN